MSALAAFAVVPIDQANDAARRWRRAVMGDGARLRKYCDRKRFKGYRSLLKELLRIIRDSTGKPGCEPMQKEALLEAARARLGYDLSLRRVQEGCSDLGRARLVTCGHGDVKWRKPSLRGDTSKNAEKIASIVPPNGQKPTKKAKSRPHTIGSAAPKGARIRSLASANRARQLPADLSGVDLDRVHEEILSAERRRVAVARNFPPEMAAPPPSVPSGTGPVAPAPSAPGVPPAPEAAAAPGESVGSKAPDFAEKKEENTRGQQSPQTGGAPVGPRSGPMGGTPSVPLAGTQREAPEPAAPRSSERPQKKAPASKPPTRLHLTVANLTAEERAMLPPSVLATAAAHTAPWLANGFLRGSLAHARERVAQGQPPWAPEPMPPEAAEDAACGRAAARAGARAEAEEKRRRARPGQPPKLRIRPPPGDHLPATPEWMQQEVACLPGMAAVPTYEAAHAGYPRAVWRQAVAKLLRQMRDRVLTPDRFLAATARGIASGDGRDPRLADLYSVEQGWPEALAVFAQVESRMPGWQVRYGGRPQKAE